MSCPRVLCAGFAPGLHSIFRSGTVLYIPASMGAHLLLACWISHLYGHLVPWELNMGVALSWPPSPLWLCCQVRRAAVGIRRAADGGRVCMHKWGAWKGQDRSLHTLFADFLSWCCSPADGPARLCSAPSLLTPLQCLTFPSLLRIHR